MTTNNQDQKFISDVIGSSLLEKSIEWIASNLNPDEVFSEKQLVEWAENAGYVPEEQA